MVIINAMKKLKALSAHLIDKIYLKNKDRKIRSLQKKEKKINMTAKKYKLHQQLFIHFQLLLSI